MTSKITASAPGRICLFGEHQDYLGLPVITMAINLRIQIVGEKKENSRNTTSPVLRINMPDIGVYEKIRVDNVIEYSQERDYFKSSLNVLMRHGVKIRDSYDITVRGNIPINSGTSSSSAMIVAWIAFLLKAAGNTQVKNPVEIAQLAHKAEVVEFNEPGGQMDHYASACGGVQFIDFREKAMAETLDVKLGDFVLGDSGEPKDTKGILARVKEGALAGLKKLDKDMFTVAVADIEEKRELLTPNQYKVLMANAINRTLTTKVKNILQTKDFNHKLFGHYLYKHYEQLRDGLDISTVKIDRMINAAMDAGALGAKINGSGGGGCMFAYAPQNSEKVAKAIEAQGGKAYRVQCDQGLNLSIDSE